MARHAIVILCLFGLGVSAIPCIDYETIYAQVHSEVDIGRVDRDYSNVNACRVTLNDSITYELYPEEDQRIAKKYYSSYDRCRIQVQELQKSDAGNISVQTTKNDEHGSTKTTCIMYNLKIRKRLEKRNVIPALKNSVYPGQHVSVQFAEEFPKDTDCRLLSPNNKEYELNDNLNHEENIQGFGNCGVKIIVKKEHTGTWILIADMKANDTAYKGLFRINVKDPKDLTPNDRNFFFQIGQPGVIKGEDLEAKFCFLQDPHGKIYPVETNSCYHTINPVNKYHEGTWKAHYGLEGIEDIVVQNITVQIYDGLGFNSSVTHSKGKINLLCRVRRRYMEFCNFVKPNGEILHMTYGIGNKKYEYYGKGIENENQQFTDCGLTMLQPEASDYGTWKCLMRFEHGENVGSILKVTPPVKSGITITSKISASNVYTKIGDMYRIACSVTEVLSYCWFRSPNGTIHSVHITKKNEEYVKEPVLKYVGAGLKLGDCAAEINEANYSHAGEWTCHLGVQNGPEIVSRFNVNIEETHLMAAQDIVHLDSGTPTDLHCQPLPESNQIIESCRWINPAGRGINVDHHGRYFTQTSITDCKLSINVIDLNEDVGKWSCFARFTNSQEEGSADIMVTSGRSLGLGSFLSISLVISLLVFISISVFILVVYKRRLALARLEEKIITTKPPKYP